MAKIIQYRMKCIGCGICMEMQSEHWRMSTRDGRAVLVRADVKKDLYIKVIASAEVESTQRVVSACPANCIKVS